MHDPNTFNNDEVQRFEKEVQQKMEELAFSPSEAVWAKVEQGIDRKKRRRLPVFWLFFLSAALLMGSAAVYFTGGHSRTQQSNDPSPNDHSTAINQSARITQPAIDEPASIRSGSLHPEAAHPEVDHPEAAKPEDNRTGTTTGTRSTVKTHSTAAPGAGPQGTPSRINSEKPAIAGSRDALLQAAQGSDKSIAGSGKTPGKLAAGDIESIGKTAKINLSPVSGKSSPKITAAPLVTKSLALTKTRLTPKRPWEAGFAGGIGISSLNQALLKRSAVAAYDNRNSLAAITGQPQLSVSKIQPDLSFWAGIFVEKPVLDRLSVSVGLNLHYYSTRISTGDKVDLTNVQYTPAGVGLYSGQALSYIAAAPIQSYPYYAAGDKQTFINRYYFLEIPASIQWQITHSRVMPLFWEAGFSLSYLMGSNALYYNAKDGVYYKDGNVTQKTQFNVSTALMVGIPFKGVNLQAGPQVQYGVTSLLNTQGTGGEHLFYGGLKFVIIPGKSHKAGKRRFSEQ